MEGLLEESPPQSVGASSWDVLDYPEGGHIKFHFGMHRGTTFPEVFRQHPNDTHSGFQEKKPSPQLAEYFTWVHRRFVVPPARAGNPASRERPFSVEEIDLDRAREEITLSKKPKSKLSMMTRKEKQDEPCAGGCPRHSISKAGSNSYVMKTTCMLCGRCTSVPRPTAQPTKAQPTKGQPTKAYMSSASTLGWTREAPRGRYLTENSPRNLLKSLVEGVTGNATTELEWSTELEAIGYLDKDER